MRRVVPRAVSLVPGGSSYLKDLRLNNHLYHGFWYINPFLSGIGELCVLHFGIGGRSCAANFWASAGSFSPVSRLPEFLSVKSVRS